MPDEERTEEIEDLEAPLDQQADVAGGAGCGRPSAVCRGITCNQTAVKCSQLSHKNVVFEQAPEAD
jgi:hypothetical protein